MSTIITEKEALAKLGAPDWRSLNKNQIMSFLFETAPNLSDEVRLKILESAPEILNTAKTIISEQQETARETLEQNHEIVDKLLDQNHDMARVIAKSYHESFETLRNLLNNPNATFEEKQYWNTELFKQLKELREFDEKNKKFITEIDNKNKAFSLKLWQYGAIAGAVVLSVSLAALAGGKIKLK